MMEKHGSGQWAWWYAQDAESSHLEPQKQSRDDVGGMVRP